MSLLARARDWRRSVDVVTAAGRWIARESVGEHNRTGFDVCEQERPQRRRARVVDDLHPTTPKALVSPLDSDLHQDLSKRTATWRARLWTSEERFVSLDSARQLVSARTDHRAAVAVQHRPGGLGGTDVEHTLQAERGDTLLVARHLPGRGEPHRERGPRPMKDRLCCRRDAPGTAGARPTTVTKPPADPCTAVRAGEAIGPPQPVQVVEARFVVREPGEHVSP